MTDFSDYGNEPSGYTNVRKIIFYVSDCQALRNY
jgi:hypothetical protein